MKRWSTDEWKVAVARMWAVKQELISVDDAFEHRLPRVACTDAEIAECEQRISESLHPEHRMLLSVAGGWPAFWHDVDILGAAEIGQGELWNDGRMRLELLESEGVVPPHTLLPVALSRHDKDLFAVVRQHHRDWGKVVWLAGEEIERFDGFQEFVSSMAEYLRIERAQLDKGMH